MSEKHESSLSKIPHVSALYATDQKFRTDGRTCDWLVTRRWFWVDENLLPSLSAFILATSRLLTVDDPDLFT